MQIYLRRNYLVFDEQFFFESTGTGMGPRNSYRELIFNSCFIQSTNDEVHKIMMETAALPDQLHKIMPQTLINSFLFLAENSYFYAVLLFFKTK